MILTKSDGFRDSDIALIPKIKDYYTKALTCDDFRAVGISPILSKVFKYCILNHYETFLLSSDNQFSSDSKKVSGVVEAIRSVRGIVDNYVARGNTPICVQ